MSCMFGDGDPDDALDEAAAHAALPAELDRRFAHPEGWELAESRGLNPHCACCRNYALGHNDRPCVVCGHYTGPPMTPGDRHLAEAHGPILTRGDLERAERECAAGCCPRCHKRLDPVLPHFCQDIGPGNAEPVEAESHPEARAAFVDGLAGLFSDAIRAGVSEEELRADFEGCLSVQAFGVTS